MTSGRRDKMKDTPETFTYTRERGAYLALAGSLTFLVLVEGSCLSVAIVALVPNDALKLALSLGLLALYGLLLAFLFAPLATSHSLDASHLYLHYGFDLDIHLPRDSILAAEPIREQINAAQAIRASYNADSQRVRAAFSEDGQVLLHLDQPRMLRIGRSPHPVAEILINVDRRDDLTRALSRAARPQVSVTLPARPQLPAMAVPARASDDSGIRIEGLTRCFDELVAVDRLSLAIPSGEICGFLGLNGAGKTTTMKMLVGLLQPTTGRAWIKGHDVWCEPRAAKAAFGYVPDEALLYERLTGREFLAFLAQLRRIPLAEAEARIGELLSVLELAEHQHVPCGTYSFGMKRKLALAGALLHRPPVLILDEPLTGLDPRSARRMKDLFQELASGGTTIFLSTHDLATAERVCERLAIIDHGRLIAQGTADEVRRRTDAPDLETLFLNLPSERSYERN